MFKASTMLKSFYQKVFSEKTREYLSLKRARFSKWVPYGEQERFVENERRSLDLIEEGSFDSGNLIAESQLNLQGVIESPSIAALWEHAKSAIQNYVLPDGTGGVSPGDRRAIYHLIASQKPHAILEVGTHIGASTLHIGLALKSYAEELDGEPSIVSVDILDVNDPEAKPWRKYGASYSPLEMLIDAECEKYTTFKVSPSLEFLEKSRQKFDFIFLDGDHSAKTVYQEISAALSILNEGGVILLHDYFPDLVPFYGGCTVTPGPFLAVSKILTEMPDLKLLPLGELPWGNGQKTNFTSLAVLVRHP